MPGVAYHETDGRNHGSGEFSKGGGADRDNFRKDEDSTSASTRTTGIRTLGSPPRSDGPPFITSITNIAGH
jgi:hypothetical protein